MNLPNDPLAGVLHEAYQRAMTGKGKQRHAMEGQPFLEQPIIQIPKMLGGSETPLLFQAVKKIYESQRVEHSVEEILDAIVYLAAAVILMRD